MHEVGADKEVGDGGDARRPPRAEKGRRGDPLRHLRLGKDVRQVRTLRKNDINRGRSTR